LSADLQAVSKKDKEWNVDWADRCGLDQRKSAQSASSPCYFNHLNGYVDAFVGNQLHAASGGAG
jgi:hypothetical protein